MRRRFLWFRQISNGYRCIAALLMLAAALSIPRSVCAEAEVTTDRLEHLDRFDPYAQREFDIPRLPQPRAFDALASALFGSSEEETDSHGEGDLVGPVKGLMSSWEAFKIVSEGCTKVSVGKVEVTKSYSDYSTSSGWYDYLNQPPASAFVKKTWNIPAMSRLDVIRAIADEYGVHINYMARTVEEEQEIIRPTYILNGDVNTAVLSTIEGTFLEAQWLYDIATNEPILSIEPASYRFSAKCKTPVVVIARRMRELDLGLPITISRLDIEQSGAKDIPELLANYSENGINRAVGASAAGTQYINLRGLGPEMFLVLLNGRRLMPSASDLNTPAFDIGGIPLPAVERIEIQVDSASTKHGSDAIAGVLNIVTSRRLNAPFAEVSYGSASGGAIERRGTLGWGVKREGGWEISTVLDTLSSSGLLGAERDIWADQNYAARYGGTDYRSRFSVRSATGEMLPGLSSPVAYLPSTPEPISLFKYRSLVPESERSSFLGTAEYAGARATATAELLWLRKRNSFAYFPPMISGVVPAENPSNPYHVPVIVNALLTGRPSLEQNVDSELRRAVLGIRGRAGDWVFEASGMTSREDAEAHLEGALNPGAVANALAASDPSLLLDVFSTEPGANLPAEAIAERRLDRFASDGDQLLVKAEGAPFRWAPGAVRLNVGLEFRREAVDLEGDDAKAERHVQSSYAETIIPLVAPSMSVRRVRALTAKVGIRSDSYSDSSSVAKKQLSLDWDVDDRLSVGVTHGQAYRPPSLYELRSPVLSFPTVIFDSRRNQVTPITFISGGNSDLKPADGSSDSAYVAYDSDGFRLQARYFSVQVSNHIALLPIETALQWEDLLPDRVVRTEPTSEDVAAGVPGRLLSVDSRRTNYGRLETSGVDVALLKQFGTRSGNWTARLSATWIDSYRFSILPIAGSPMSDRVGIADVRGSITRWRSIASLGWTDGPWNLSTDLKFVPSYKDSKKGREIGSQKIWDARFSYALTDKISVALVLSDILDTSPPFAFVGAATGWDWTQWDPVGRRWSVAMQVSL
jgi:iron complex outermembrane receptor protein